MTKGFKEVNSSVNTLINNIDKTGTKVASLESKLENLKKGTVKTDAYKELEDSVKRQSAEYDKQVEKYNELIAQQTELQNSNHAYGKEWEDATPQDIKYITGSNGKALTFTAASISDKEWNAYIAELSGTPIPDNGGANGGNGGSGDDADAELTATAAASEKDAGSKSKSAVSTADESPIGTMSALAALSLLAGGYIVVRKRKKEEQ